MESKFYRQSVCTGWPQRGLNNKQTLSKKGSHWCIWMNEKCCHDLDLLNWILKKQAAPREVYSVGGNMLLCLICLAVLFLLHRQIILLSVGEEEARMLGVRVGRLRLIIMLTATLCVSCIVSLTGLISFVGLLAPHGARLLTKRSSSGTMLLGGLLGGILLTGADILARCAAASELPVSIFTSLLGAPFLILLIIKERNVCYYEK